MFKRKERYEETENVVVKVRRTTPRDVDSEQVEGQREEAKISGGTPLEASTGDDSRPTAYPLTLKEEQFE